MVGVRHEGMDCCPTCGNKIEGISFYIDMEQSIAIINDKAYRLSKREAELLFILRQQHPRFIPVQTLVTRVFGAHNQSAVESNLRVIVLRLRKVLAKTNWRVTNQHDHGYALRRLNNQQ